MVLSGCSLLSAPQTPIPSTASEVSGLWVDIGAGHQRATLRLEADGTFTASNIPYEVFAYSGSPSFTSTVDWSRTRSLSGTWRFGDGRDGTYPFIDLRIAQQSVPTLGTAEMLIDGSGSRMTIETPVGPIDDGVMFSFTHN